MRSAVYFANRPRTGYFGNGYDEFTNDRSGLMVETNISYIIEATGYVLEGKETYDSVKRWLDALNVHIPADTIPRIIREVQSLYPNIPISQITLTVQYVCTGRTYSTGPYITTTQPTTYTTTVPPTQNSTVTPYLTTKEKEEKGFPSWGWMAIAAGAVLLLKGKI